MFRMTGAGSKFDGRLVNDLGVDFIRDLKRITRRTGLRRSGLRRNTALSYSTSFFPFQRDVRRTSRSLPRCRTMDSRPSREVKDPYRKLTE